MPIQILAEDLVLAIHADLIDTYGGSHGLRDRNLLLSALDRVENRLHYEPEVTVPMLAASLGWGLIKNHVFLDGNKRIGLAAIITFLDVNDHMFVVPENEVKSMVLRVAASDLTEAEWSPGFTPPPPSHEAPLARTRTFPAAIYNCGPLSDLRTISNCGTFPALPSILGPRKPTNTDYRKFNKRQDNHRTPQQESINLPLL